MLIRTLPLLLVGCGLDSSYFFDSSGTYFGHTERGYAITDFDEWGDSARRMADGAIEYSGVATVTLRHTEVHRVDALAIVDPLARGGRRMLGTSDLTTGDERVFAFDVEEDAIVFGDFDGGVFVAANGDGTYGVYTGSFVGRIDDDAIQLADDGYEAWKLVQEYNQFSDTSRHALTLAFAMALQPLVPARSLQMCAAPHCGGSSTQVRVFDESAPGAGVSGYGVDKSTGGDPVSGRRICDTFEAFCLCLACEISAEREDACLPCD